MPCSRNSVEVIPASAEARMNYLTKTNCHHHFALAGRITDSSFFLRIKTQITLCINKTCCPTKRSFPLQILWLPRQNHLRNPTKTMRCSWTQGESSRNRTKLINKDEGKHRRIICETDMWFRNDKTFKWSGCQEGIKETFQEQTSAQREYCNSLNFSTIYFKLVKKDPKCIWHSTAATRRWVTGLGAVEVSARRSIWPSLTAACRVPAIPEGHPRAGKEGCSGLMCPPQLPPDPAKGFS